MKFFIVVFMFLSFTVINVSVSYADKKAVEKYNKECDAGNSKSCFELGLIYANGKGVTKNSEKAFKMYKKACDGENSSGCSNLAIMYVVGEGVAVDYDKALTISKKSCEMGDENSCKFNEILADKMKN